MSEKLARFKNLALASGIVFVLLYGLFGIESCNMKSKSLKQENSIDSVKLRKNELVEKFDCDTSILFNRGMFTYQKNEVLNKLKRPLLVQGRLKDIYQNSDTTLVIIGDCFDIKFGRIGFQFEINKQSSTTSLNKRTVALFVIQKIELRKLTNNSINSDSTVLFAQCIHTESFRRKKI